MKLILTAPAVAPSPLSRWDPRWKLATLLLSTAVVAMLQTVAAAAAAAALAVLLAEIARVPRRWYLRRVGAILLLLLLFLVWLPLIPGPGPAWMVGSFRIAQSGLEAAALVLLKAAAIVILMLLLWVTAPLEATLKAGHALRIPAVLLHIVFLAYRYLFLLADEFARLRTALRVRGFRNRGNLHSYRTIGHVSGILLVRSVERSERVAAAMRCRGFDGQFRCLIDFRTRPADVAASFLIAAPIMAILTWDLFAR